MRILVANDGLNDAGGVTTYLHAVCANLQERGHAIAWLHCADAAGAPDVPASACWSAATLGSDRAIEAVAAWQPDVCFSHNMRALDVETALAGVAPVVKMMHGYFGTCVSGSKSFGWPTRHACTRTLGLSCLALYLPRRCGRLHPGRMLEQYRFAVDQRSFFSRYRAIVVASGHMRDEYIRGGAPGDRVHAIPLFAPPVEPSLPPPSVERAVVFIGRMTSLKGGDLLVRAIAGAERRLSRRVPLVMAGDGPERSRLESLARRMSVDATFPGWIDRVARSSLLQRASLLVVPGTWPEPFGLVGLEAAACGVPSVAFDTGGIREWLRDGETGLMAGAQPDALALATAVACVLADPPLHARLSAGALRMAHTLTLDRHVGELERVLEAASDARPIHA